MFCSNEIVNWKISNFENAICSNQNKQIDYREGSKSMIENMESALTAGASAICPWDQGTAAVSVSVCPWDEEEAPSTSKQSTKYLNI